MKKNQLNLHKLLHDKSYLSAFASLYSLEYYESHHILKIDSSLEELFADSDIHWIQNPKHTHGFTPEKNHWNFCNGKTPTVYPNGIILEQNHKTYYTNRIVCSGMYIDFDTLYDEDFDWNKDDVEDYMAHLKESRKWKTGGERREG